MGLAEYKRKRDFKKTPEPAPERKVARGARLSYLIQKHAATRLHYDFRLELDGALLSWAVTRGPSLDPKDKRLAVRVEDHPLSYGDFEGTIPKGQYGGGTVMLWDVGSWEPKGDPHAGLKKGHLSFTLHGARLKGDWALIRMRGKGKRENWLLIKAQDDQARRQQGAELLEDLSSSVKTGRSMAAIAGGEKPVKPKKPSASRAVQALMRKYPSVELATLVDAPPQGAAWLHEIKFDGYRLLGFLSAGEVRLRTRNGQDWTAKFPAIAAAVGKLKARDAVLDMEAVVLDASGKSSFQALQAALGQGESRERIIGQVFDLLQLDGQELTGLKLTARKSQLEALLERSKAGWALRFSGHVVGNGAEMLAKSCKLGLEGIVSKRADTPYRARRGKSWLKSKCGRRQEFVILGHSDAKSGGRALGALYLGYHQDGELKYAGKVGTGFSMASAKQLAQRLARWAAKKPVLERAAMDGVTVGEWRAIHWAKPKLLGEVAFTEWTKDGQVRHPSFQGLREDKKADEVKLERSTVPILISHPERVISKVGKVTKGDLAAYYAAVAPLMLPRIARHPLSLLRCPTGIEGGCFYQRNPGKGLGADVHPFKFKHKGKSYEYLYIEDERGLLELIQMGAIEIHPWGASIDAIDFPDRMIFDLDPAPGVPFDALKLAAKDLRARLRKKGLESVLKCTGGKGLHVTVPLAAKDPWPAVKEFAFALAHEMVRDVPQAYVATMTKAKRTGKIFIDFFRNDYTATAIADYAVRARPGAPPAVPLEWRELDRLTSAAPFTLDDVVARLKKKKPPVWPTGQRL